MNENKQILQYLLNNLSQITTYYCQNLINNDNSLDKINKEIKELQSELKEIKNLILNKNHEQETNQEETIKTN